MPQFTFLCSKLPSSLVAQVLSSLLSLSFCFACMTYKEVQSLRMTRMFSISTVDMKWTQQIGVVTGEGQKTSSVLDRALSRVEMRFRQRQVRLVRPKLRKRKSYLSVETEETQLGSLRDQVSSYLYYTRYAERPTTDATWNTPIV